MRLPALPSLLHPAEVFAGLSGELDSFDAILVPQAAHTLGLPGCDASDVFRAARRLLRSDRPSRLGLLWARVRSDGPSTLGERLNSSLADASSAAGASPVCALAAKLEDDAGFAQSVDPLAWHDATSSLLQQEGFNPIRHRRMLDSVEFTSWEGLAGALAVSLDCTVGLAPQGSVDVIQEHVSRLGALPVSVPLSLHAWHCVVPPSRAADE